MGRTSEDALRREIKEETDLDIVGIEFVLVQDCIHSKEFIATHIHSAELHLPMRWRGECEIE